MRRKLLLVLLAFATLAPAVPALAQQRRGGQEEEDPAEAARKRQRAREFSDFEAPLPGQTAAGPCPFVKVLYDAARYVEFKDNREAFANVGYTGEIEGVNAQCSYQGADPIKVDLKITFALGRGPQAPAPGKDYTYWVAVTTRNRDVLAKERFTVHGDIPNGQNRVLVAEHIAGIQIPRADDKVSGANFEILVGFDVTPQMAEFNREGKRFRPEAGAPPAGTAAAR